MKRVRGVADAHFSYERRVGRVTYDPRVTAPVAFITALRAMTGFEASVLTGAAVDAVGAGHEQEEKDK